MCWIVCGTRRGTCTTTPMKGRAAGLLDGKATLLKLPTSIQRTGADILKTYFAKDVAKEIK